MCVLHSLCFVATDEPVACPRQGEPVIGDFSKAKMVLEEDKEDVLDFEWRQPATRHPHSLRWTAPEFICDESIPPNFKIDIWSLGMVILEVFTGARPYKDVRGEERLIYLIWTEGLRPERPLRCRWLSDEVWQLMHDCWATDPAQRPDASEVYQRLHEADQAFSKAAA